MPCCSAVRAAHSWLAKIRYKLHIYIRIRPPARAKGSLEFHPMSNRLEGKHCLITAAGAGIGRESALAFAREGAVVLAADIDARALESLALENSSIRPHVLDVTDSVAIDAL